METENNTSSWNRRIAWLALFVIVLGAVAMVLAPVWIIMPFKAQSQGGVELSYTLRRWSPLVTLIATVASLALVAWLWSVSRRWWLKAAMAIVVVPLLVVTWFARQNHFEWMFNPLASPAYAQAGETDFVADADMVLAIENNGEAVAYPVRLMAYHHIVQDVVGGKPVVATY